MIVNKYVCSFREEGGHRVVDIGLILLAGCGEAVCKIDPGGGAGR